MAQSNPSNSSRSAAGGPASDDHGASDISDTLPDDRPHNGGHAGVMRFFDTSTGGHFFTASINEQNTLLASRHDLIAEGTGFFSDDAGTQGAVDVYRFFDTHSGGHFYTINAAERDTLLHTRPDMAFEGVSMQQHNAAATGYTAVYRFFDTHDGGHLFTSDAAERASLLGTRPDLVAEGIAFYASKT